MIRRAALVATLLLLLTAASASAAAQTVQVYDYSFNPAGKKVHVGDTVAWHNNGNFTHEPKSKLANLWDKTVASKATTSPVNFAHAGTFSYFCVIHPFMTGKIKVTMGVSPASGSLNTTFTLTVATANAPTGWTEDIQMRRGTAAFANWKQVTGQTTTFKPTLLGSYDFRARYRRTSDNAATGWSPSLNVMVFATR
jgi:plastocyanin